MVTQFDFIASTGRTATTFIAAVLDSLSGVTACHEGYAGADKTSDPLLPLINLENAQAYDNPEAAARVVASKRGKNVFDAVTGVRQVNQLIDVAYYNATIASEILRQNSASRMIGIVRECEPFVRSATSLHGEDPLPVGWADANKPLSDREKFIAMGRMRPRRTSREKSLWPGWSAIEKNIWLWRETNALLGEAQGKFPDRVRICRFETFRSHPDHFWAEVTQFLDLPDTGNARETIDASKQNQKPSGYQIPVSQEWTRSEQQALAEAQRAVDKGLIYDW